MQPNPNPAPTPGLRALQRHSKEWAADPASAVIADCTSLQRFGLRGTGAADWLDAQGVAVPDKVNRLTLDAAGLMVMRLGQNDITLSGEGARAMATRWQQAEGRKGFDGYRQDTWAHLVISGPAATLQMAELTEIDLREAALPPGTVAQTQLLQVATVIARSDPAGVPGYELFFDITTLPYMLETLHHLAPGYRFVALPG